MAPVLDYLTLKVKTLESLESPGTNQCHCLNLISQIFQSLLWEVFPKVSVIMLQFKLKSDDSNGHLVTVCVCVECEGCVRNIW
jgi:hypothetical protein